MAQSPREPGKPRRKNTSALYMCPASKRRFLIVHLEGVTPANKKRQTALQRWKRSSVVSSSSSAND